MLLSFRQYLTFLCYYCIGCSLMFFPEIALYALDVYYNQTYGSSTAGSKADTVDNSSGANAYNNLYSSTSQKYSIYGDYPPYYDYFHGTYRKFSPNWKNLDRILDWIEIASET